MIVASTVTGGLRGRRQSPGGPCARPAFAADHSGPGRGKGQSCEEEGDIRGAVNASAGQGIPFGLRPEIELF